MPLFSAASQSHDLSPSTLALHKCRCGIAERITTPLPRHTILLSIVPLCASLPILRSRLSSPCPEKPIPRGSPWRLLTDAGDSCLLGTHQACCSPPSCAVLLNAPGNAHTPPHHLLNYVPNKLRQIPLAGPVPVPSHLLASRYELGRTGISPSMEEMRSGRGSWTRTPSKGMAMSDERPCFGADRAPRQRDETASISRTNCC